MKNKEVVTILLNKGQTIFVDKEAYEDIPELKKKWTAQRQGYAIRNQWNKETKKHKTILAHRVIWEYYHGEIPEGYELDFINRIKSDCRLENLRLATRSQNRMNIPPAKCSTSIYKGVSYYEAKNKWRAQIKINNKVKHLGYFEYEEDAAKRYDQEAKKLFGEFANINGVK